METPEFDTVAGRAIHRADQAWRWGVSKVDDFSLYLRDVIENEYWAEFDLGEGRVECRKSLAEWIELPPPKGLGTTCQEVKAKLIAAKDAEDIVRVFEAATAGKRAEAMEFDPKERGRKGGRGNKATYVVSSFGNTKNYLLARIAKQHPDILDRYEAGEFPSVRQAAIAAGIIKVETPLEKAVKAFTRLEDSERDQFLTLIANE